MDAIGGLLAFFKTLPDLIKLLNRLGDVMDRFMKWTQANHLEEWITDLETSIDQLERAKTSEEKISAAKNIVGIVRDL